MTTPGDRRVAIPVSVHPKISFWKSFRQNIRRRLRRFTHRKDRNQTTDQRNDIHEYNHDYVVDSSSLKPETNQSSGHGRPTDHRKSGNRTGGDTTKLQRVASNPESNKQVTRQSIHHLPFNETHYQSQETVRQYESSYTAHRFDPSGQQAQHHLWDASQDHYALKLYRQHHSYPVQQAPIVYYCQSAADDYEDPYYLEDPPQRYEYPEDIPQNVNIKMQTRKPQKDGEKIWRGKDLLTLYVNPCLRPKITCASEVFATDTGIASNSLNDETEVSRFRTTTSGEPKIHPERPPGGGILESTILQTYTDNTMDASALEVEAHNAILQLSNKVRKEVHYSAEEVKAVFVKATEAILMGNHQKRMILTRETSIKDAGYGKYFEKFTGCDAVPGSHSVGETTDSEDETMNSSVARSSSSSKAIGMTWPQWRHFTHGTMSFGKHHQQ